MSTRASMFFMRHFWCATILFSAILVLPPPCSGSTAYYYLHVGSFQFACHLHHGLLHFFIVKIQFFTGALLGLATTLGNGEARHLAAELVCFDFRALRHRLCVQLA